MTLAHTFRVRPAEGHFQFGWEAGRIAQALVHGFGYSDPFSNAYVVHTGPTAWLPPLYPLMIAGVFKVFGVYTRASAWVILAINCVFSAATAMAVWEIGARCFNRRVALWSGWLWALYPAAMQYAVRWVWEMSITTALFAWTVVLALRMREIQGSGVRVQSPDSLSTSALEIRRASRQAGYWASFGLLWGLIALSNSTLLLFLPVCGLWILSGTWRRPHALRDATLAASIFVACLVPWTWRNALVFHTFIPLRGNLGAELFMGNGPGSNGLLMEFDHPFQAPEQLRLYKSMGESPVRRHARSRGEGLYGGGSRAFRRRRGEARLFLLDQRAPPLRRRLVRGSRPRGELRLSQPRRIAGPCAGAAQPHSRAGLFTWAFLLLPVPYYLVTVHARFRHPLEPLICILSVYLFQSAESRKAAPRSSELKAT